MIRNLQGGRFINNKEKYYFPSSAAGSSVATAFCYKIRNTIAYQDIVP